MTKTGKPNLPAIGGSFVRQPDGSLQPAHAAEAARGDRRAPADTDAARQRRRAAKAGNKEA